MEGFATKLKSERKRLGMSQSQLAEVLDVAPLTISRWERGDVEPHVPGAILKALSTMNALARDKRRFNRGGRPAAGEQ